MVVKLRAIINLAADSTGLSEEWYCKLWMGIMSDLIIEIDKTGGNPLLAKPQRIKLKFYLKRE